MNVKNLTNFFFSYDHVFTNYFLGKRRAGKDYPRGRSMLNSLAVIYASYYPELDLTIYRSTQTSLRLLFGLNSLDDVSRNEAFGVKAFLNRTTDSWYFKYGHYDILPLGATRSDVASTFSRNGFFHRLLFDEYRVQFRKTWLQQQYFSSSDLAFTDQSLDLQYSTLRDKNPYLFLSTKSFPDFSLLESRFGDCFYKPRESCFGNYASSVQHEAVMFESYLVGRHLHEKLRTGLNLDVRFKQGFARRSTVDETRRGVYYFYYSFNKLVFVNYLGIYVQNMRQLQRVLNRLLAPSFVPGTSFRLYSWLSIIVNVSNSNWCGFTTQYRWRQIYKLVSLSQQFGRVGAQFCETPAFNSVLCLDSFLELPDFLNSSSFSFVRGEWSGALCVYFFRSHYLKLGRSVTPQSIFGKNTYPFLTKIQILAYDLNKVAAIARRRFWAGASACFSLLFLKMRRFEFLSSTVSQFLNLLMLAELRLNNLYAFRVLTQLAVGYPGMYLPDTKYEQIFTNLKFFFRNVSLQKKNMVVLRNNLVIKKVRVTSRFFVVVQETMIFIEFVTKQFVNWGHKSQLAGNVLSRNVCLSAHMFFLLSSLFRLMSTVNANARSAQIVTRNATSNLVFETMPDLRVVININWALGNGTAQQITLGNSLHSARFLHFNLNHYHKALAVKLSKLHSSGFVSEPYGVFIDNKVSMAVQAANVIKRFARMTAVSATPNLSAVLQLNYGRSGILNIFRSVGVADYSQFFNLYAQAEAANFSLTKQSLLLDGGAARIRGSASYMFFDALSKAFFTVDLRDLHDNSAGNLLAPPYDAPLFFSDHLKLRGFLNMFDYYLPSLDKMREPAIHSMRGVNSRDFLFFRGRGLYTKNKYLLSRWTRNSRFCRISSFERNLILGIICDELLKI